MCRLVGDVRVYPEFVPFLKKLRVIKEEPRDGRRLAGRGRGRSRLAGDQGNVRHQRALRTGERGGRGRAGAGARCIRSTTNGGSSRTRAAAHTCATGSPTSSRTRCCKAAISANKDKLASTHHGGVRARSETPPRLVEHALHQRQTRRPRSLLGLRGGRCRRSASPRASGPPRRAAAICTRPTGFSGVPPSGPGNASHRHDDIGAGCASARLRPSPARLRGSPRRARRSISRRHAEHLDLGFVGIGDEAALQRQPRRPAPRASVAAINPPVQLSAVAIVKRRAFVSREQALGAIVVGTQPSCCKYGVACSESPFP